MKAASHRFLGEYLLSRYMPDLPERYARAFLMGCVEPDRNPATYLKGSIRSQWLRGHNWGNAHRYMSRVSARLERKERRRIWDYYSLGKLIHYIADSFTYVHNAQFENGLRDHRSYERMLQAYFLQYLGSCPESAPSHYRSAMEAVNAYHRDYVRNPGSFHTDASYTVTVCGAVLSLLMLHRCRSASEAGRCAPSEGR